MDSPSRPARPARTPFIGRTEELERIGAMLDQGTALVTLLGPPGMGKTTLSHRFASHAIEQGRFASDAVVFCDLSNAWSVEDIVTVVSGALGAHLSSAAVAESTVEMLGRAIEGRGPVLLILDNFEQVVDHAAETLSLWLDQAPQARFVATSRVRLRLRGEASLELPPLPTEHGIELFLRTARLQREHFDLDEAERAAVTELIARLDGIPLAIELAAARVTVMSPSRMLDRIDRRFQLLRHGPSDGVARQATLRAAIDWSWELLEPAERTTLAQCAVFRGGFSLDAAEAVVTLEGDEDVLDLLEVLCGKSLLRSSWPESAQGEIRFDMYESIAAYAFEHLSKDGEDTATHQRHATHFIEDGDERIEDFASPEGTDLAWFDLNRDNLVAVVQRQRETAPDQAARAALCLAHTMIRRGPFDALARLLEQIPEGIEDGGDAALSTRLVLARGVALSVTGRREEAEALLQRSLEAATKAKLIPMVIRSHLHLGLHRLRSGQLAEAREHLAPAVDMAAEQGLERLRARGLASMGMSHEGEALFEEAERCYTEAIAIAQKLGDRWEMARCRSKMGSLCTFQEGRLDEARGHLEWALEESSQVGDSFIGSGTAYNLGRLELNVGHLEPAEENLCKALGSFREMANLGSEGFVRISLGLLHLDREATDTARGELGLARDILDRIGHPLALAYTEMTLALASLVDGDVEQAEAHAETARTSVAEQGHTVLEGLACCVSGIVAGMSNRSKVCKRDRDRAQECLAESGWAEGLAMLEAVNAWAEELDGKRPDLPEERDVRHARARVGWRLLRQTRSGLSEARRIRRRALQTRESAENAGPPDALIVDRKCRWFRPPGGEIVDLTRKRTLKPLLLLLVEARLENPGDALGVDHLFQGVWPGERILERARKNRVYVGMATLRKMGLGDTITTRGDGYLLNPDIPVSWAD